MSTTRDTIAVVSSGGTFGMRDTARGLAPAPVRDRIRRLVDGAPRPCEVFELEPQIDSAHAAPADWQRLVDVVAELGPQHSGIVIIHGTDTMAYAAAAVAIARHVRPSPVVFTGAQIPIAVSDSDGPANLEAALRRTARIPTPRVEICFGGQVINGARATKLSATGLAAFGEVPFAHGHDGGRTEATPPTALEERFEGFGDDEIPVLRCYPGMSAATMDRMIAGRRAVVLQCYGYGNLPTNEAILRVLRTAIDAGTLVVAISQCAEPAISLGVSHPTTALAESGVISGHDLTTEAALAKLHYLLRCDLSADLLQEWLVTPLAHEMSVNGP
ncbi:L-asparaginase 1 [Microlunatus endophyticus]|uniref:L-asparaginase 1 n=1 Tax=Microlunatus endophyticus TaxID=1716077 RepID=A0A917S444_9ACTN|nr:asparaginase domain-containing protein [Microlunatus endophyticus]GGL57168.1 L-asparaginase 1 [Microlunatus endophyticus]